MNHVWSSPSSPGDAGREQREVFVQGSHLSFPNARGPHLQDGAGGQTGLSRPGAPTGQNPYLEEAGRAVLFGCPARSRAGLAS